MTTLSAAFAILSADTTLLALATGGVWDINTAGADGIGRTNTPSAFDSALNIKPCVLVKLRSTTPDYVLADDASQYVTAKEMIEVWLYQFRGIDQIDSMKLRIFALLHAKQLAGTFQVRWQFDTQPLRDVDLDAFVLRSDYLAVVKRSV